MKKLIILILFLSIVTSISCNKSTKREMKNQFSGIGEFIIGAKFDTLKSYKLFDKKTDTEFNIEKFELTKEIGIIEDLTIKTENGKIYEVSFSKGKFTNEIEIDSYFKNLEETEFSKEKKMNNEIAEYLFYVTEDKKVGFDKTTMIDKELAVVKGYYDADYIYNDIIVYDRIRKKAEKAKDSLEKSIYMEDVKSVK